MLPLNQLDFSRGHQLVTSWFPIFIISAALNSEEPDLHTYKNTKTRKRANAWWGFSSRLLTRQGPHLTTSSKWVGKPGGRTENVLLATHPLLSASWRPFAPGFHYKPGFANYLWRPEIVQNTTYCIGKIIHKAASIKVCKPVVNKYSGLRIPQLLTHYISSKVRLCLYIQAVKLVKHLYTLYTLWPSSREFDAFQINLPLKISMPAHPPASAGF